MFEVIMMIVAILIAIAIVVIFVINNVSVFAPLAERLRVQMCVWCEDADNTEPCHKDTMEKPMIENVCVYVSGAISGLSPSAVTLTFARGVKYACDVLMHAQANVINPSLLGAQYDVSTWTHAQFMAHWQMVICTKVTHMMMLPGWERSTGARMEHEWAIELGITIHYMCDDVSTQWPWTFQSHTDDFPPLWEMLYTEDDFNPHEDDWMWDMDHVSHPYIDGREDNSWYTRKRSHGWHEWKTDKIKHGLGSRYQQSVARGCQS